MEITGPMSESGGITAQTREPSSQARVHDGRGIVDAPAHRGDDAVDDHAHVRLVLEPYVGLHQPPAALHVDVIEPVHHDVADGGVLEQRLERAEAEDLVEDLLDEALALGERHGKPLVENELLHHRAHLRVRGVLVQDLELIRGERIQQLVMHLALQFEPAVRAANRAGPGDGNPS